MVISSRERVKQDDVVFEPYIKMITESAFRHNLVLHFGTYSAVQGPSYETPAEIKMLNFAGADAVGMSTVPEIILAKKLGMHILPLSCITNAASGISSQPLTHQEVQNVADSISGAFISMMTDIIKKINYFHRW
jgi:purine-nucleoside phosphorylase